MPSFLPLRSVLWIGFFAVILVAWWVMFDMSRSMGTDLFGRMPTGMAGMERPMASPGFATLAPMWAVMMAAMMLPTLVPTLRAYEDLIRAADGSRAGWLGVILGYFTVWIGFALLIAAAQVALTGAGLLDAMGAATAGWASGALLVAAGAFQFSRMKAVCHGVCHSPMFYFLGHWRAGFVGGLRMGLGLGAFCVGCCWMIMALGFAGGVMNLLWMGLATLFMVAEKLPQLAHRVVRPAGVALMLAGAAVWMQALGLLG
ncbi:DUF2182 domain-containing protein [Oceaniglobus roseus]|uniref:DUF2182 domain-containing protein n=1 Tax=Oceaniglobus roseus TaxID=1737570 RepID=UPI000C7F2271|nr:DUF2182 domain-containing protein [Kandeliimicrobium roseum]